MEQGQPIQTKSKKVGNRYVQHLGSLDASSILLVVGRDNFRKKSAPIEALVLQLHQLGMPVCWYERKVVQDARLRDEEFAAVCQSWLCAFSKQHPTAGFVARKIVRLYLKTKYPKRYGYFFKKISLASGSTPADLQRFIRSLGAHHVFILSHSAGGITASLIESEEAVRKLVCIGYPFKHPDKSDEAYRTAHLAHLKKPFLIIQGQHDEYGTAQDAARYRLSPTVQVESIDCGHDYADLSETDFNNTLRRIAHFLGLSSATG